MLEGLKKQKSVITHSQQICDDAVKACYLIANEIALASKPSSAGEFCEDMHAEGCRDCVSLQISA